MARLKIEIDTGELNKLQLNTIGGSHHRTICALIKLVEEAAYRLEKMGRDANGIVLYGPDGPRGKITLTESDKRKGEPRNWYDDTVNVGVPLSERRWHEPHRTEGKGLPDGVKIIKKGDLNACGGWHWVNRRLDTENGPFASAQDALDDSIKAVGLAAPRDFCRQNVCWCHDDGTELITPYCSHCGCKA